eukprot:gnl/TRDRNA2_/TRDRNA2_162743_c0_seq1.p1 gnl/TRDRNA2_/TRDRNA2_162743_c0~~gnl/TRDRNA2_/TRDRNA2_162743_c0_seq1.p1  ORF type:complete len:619 (+),score=83.55 gnl/TRDRNA2_/TRDRNA2_162743_c0_seq1:64-1857(+)
MADVSRSFAIRELMQGLTTRDQAQFWDAAMAIGKNVLWAEPVSSFKDMLFQVLEIKWTRNMKMRFITSYLQRGEATILKVEARGLPCPEDVIILSIEAYIKRTIAILGMLFAIMPVAAQGKILWDVSPSLVYIIVAYQVVTLPVFWFLFADWASMLLKGMNESLAVFRYSLIRIRENAEAISLLHGEAHEQSHLLERLKVWLNHWWMKEVLDCFYSVLESVSSFCLNFGLTIFLLGQYLVGYLDVGSIGQVHLAVQSVTQSVQALCDPLIWVSIGVHVDRLDFLQWTIQRGKGFEDSKRTDRLAFPPEEDTLLECLDVDVAVPSTKTGADKVILLRGVDFVIKKEDSVLIMGPSGCGKTALLRTIARVGDWRPAHGAITITHLSNVVFVPQKPFLATGPFLTQLYYPQTGPWQDGNEMPLGGLEAAADWLNERPAVLAQILYTVNIVGLGPLVRRLALGAKADLPDEEDIAAPCSTKDLRTVVTMELDWIDTLSTSEKQRFAFARLLLAQPKLAFLDNATSALDEATEIALYQCLRDLGCAYVTVGNKPELIMDHDRVLEISSDGSCELVHAEDCSVLPTSDKALPSRRAPAQRANT